MSVGFDCLHARRWICQTKVHTTMNQRLHQLTQLLLLQYRIANPGPLGLYAFGYTTALLQVCPLIPAGDASF